VEQLCLNDILVISQKTQLSYFDRFGRDIFSEKTLYSTFLTGCRAEITSVLDSAIDCTLADRCVFVCSSPEASLDSGSVLKSIFLVQDQSGVETMLETADGTTTKFIDTSLWLGCSSYGVFNLDAENIKLVKHYLSLGNLVNPVSGKIEWPRKNIKRRKVLACVE